MAAARPQEASSFTSQCTYDVFLSFRGADTRKTFTDHLYRSLVDAGFRTFRDDNEIERGENINSELEKAIQQSKSSIIVFSKNYASSRWCLDELVMILERRSTKGHAILPVFYHVDPSQVRKQTGSFAKALARHEKRFKEETDERKKEQMVHKVDGWRAALTEVADLGGLVLRNQADGHESKFIRKIVTVIEDKVNHTILSVAPYLIGIDSRVKNISLWLQNGSTDFGIVAICGMSGIGKTTIAKYVFSIYSERFEGSSFLANVREISEQPNGLVRLQSQLLSDILKMKRKKIQSVDEGIIRVKDAICNKRVLVVLDDVDHIDQLDAIFGMQEWFYPGSKIIITTRYMLLLKARELYEIHDVEKLDNDESLELFSWHAFGQDHPADDYIEHSQKVIKHCEGLPLALQVLGSSLRGKCLDVWESALEKLKAIPDSRILKKLRISYDSLQDDHDKNLFLEIACFFIEKDKDYMVAILDECDFYTTVGIQNLIDRCLLAVDENNKLIMHQMLRDMGREIVRQESPKEPGKRSRLWHYKDSFNVLREKSGTEKIEGLILDMHMFREDKSARSYTKKRRYEEFVDRSLLSNPGASSKRHYFSFFSWQSVETSITCPNEVDLHIDAFASMGLLRLLQLNYVQLTGCYQNFPKNLRLLCWHGFPLKSVPFNFPLENLVALDMSYSKLEQVWEGTKFLAGSLKILNLSYSQRLARTPDFTKLPNLERLILKGCVSLVQICESIGFLEGLVLLNLEDCKNLKKFPNIGMLKFLETLIISGCTNIGEFPMELRSLESLKILYADGIDINPLPIAAREVKLWHAFLWLKVLKPRKSPEVFLASLPCSLVGISLSDCNLSSDSFPRDFSNLFSLRKLDLSKNPICSLPDCIKSLSRLQELYLNSCSKLQSVLGLPSVETLRVGESTSLERVTYQSTLFVSPDFEHTKCPKLDEIQGLFKLEPIEKVDGEIINNLGLLDLEWTPNMEVQFHHNLTNEKTKRPIQGLYEFGIFSTFIPGNEVPISFSSKSNGSSIAFTVPSLPNLRIRGMNVCSVYALSNIEEIWYPAPLFTKISNKTKDVEWIYSPFCFGIPEADENLIWLSHWKFQNQLECGDEVNVLIVVGDGFQVKECGINLVYSEQEEETQHNSTYLSWKEVIGGDLSAFQLSTGAYFLSHHGFGVYVKEHNYARMEDWTTASWFRKLCGDLVKYTEVKLWGWSGPPSKTDGTTKLFRKADNVSSLKEIVGGYSVHF